MAYTAAQLVAAYTAANDGIAPDAATTATLTSYANQNAAGQLTDAQALGNVINTADKTTAVAVQAYQFFTGASPTKAGLDFLVNSATNANDLNDAYYSQFNIENRYINFAANLGIQGEGAANFAATYGAMSFPAFVAAAYEQVIGAAYASAAGINVAAATADIISRQQNFVNIARDRGLITSNSTQAQIDIATKAAVIGYLLVEGIKADVGLYAAGSNNFLAALINGNPQYNVNILTTYSPLGGGIGQPVPPGGIATLLQTSTDAYNGTAANDVVNGVVFSDSPGTTTFNLADTINGNGGLDTLNLTVSRATGAGSTGAVVLPAATLTSVETVNVRAASSTPADVTTVNAIGFTGTTAVNSDRSISAVTITNLAAGASAGLIGDGTSNIGDLKVGYATLGSAATINVSGGVKGAPNITITSTPASVTLNTTGAQPNVLGTLALGTAATALTINAASTLTLAGIMNFAPNATITVNGAATNVAGSAASPGSAAVTLGVLESTVGTVNASGLTAGGVSATIGANAALNFTGGAGTDTITVASGTAAGLTGTINGGGGVDQLIFSNAADLSAAIGGKFVNFETVAFVNGGVASSLATYNPTQVASSTTLLLGSTGSIALTGLNAGAATVVGGNLAGTNAAGALSLQLANAGGAADVLTLQLDNTANFTTTPPASGVTIASLGLGGTAVVGQVETLNIVSGGSIGAAGTYNNVTLQASGAGPNFVDPNTINVTGNQGLSLFTGTLGHALTVNAAGMTGGGLIFNSVADGAFAVNVTGSGFNDTISVGVGQTGQISGGAGGDAITLNTAQQVIAFAAGDSKLDLTGTAGASGVGLANTGQMDSITGFTSGTDKISLGANLAGVAIADKGAAANAAAVTTLLATSTFFQDGGGAVQKVAEFDYSGGTVLVVDSNGNGAYDASDLAVFFVGINNIASGDLI